MGRKGIAGIVVILTILLSALGAYGVLLEQSSAGVAQPETLFSFELNHGALQERILPWQDEDGTYYVFLPSYASMSELTLSPEGRSRLLVAGQQRRVGQTFGDCYFGIKYPLETEEGSAQIEFRRSDNVAAMFVSVQAEGFFDSEDKEREEKVTVSLLDEDGQRETTDMSGRLKGHGNSTWEADKKPYTLTLDKAAGILGMKSAKKWILLANAYDATNLKNKVVLDLANAVFSDWSPQGVYADVYLNGAYNGLYLICEKVEIAENRVSKDSVCLLTQETVRRDRKQEYVTDRDVAMEIAEPKHYDEEQYDEIAENVQAMEDALFAEGKGWKSYMDADSWAKRYLIDQFSGNFDADKLSSYCYAKEENGHYKFYGGPVWDYDKAFMQEDSEDVPYLFAAAAEYRRRNVYTPYYRQLLNKEGFRRKTAKIYRTKFKPLLDELAESGLDELASEIRIASANNFQRCQPFDPPVGYTHESLTSALSAMRLYIKERIRQMDDMWLEGTPYYIVGIEPSVGGKIREYEVRAGEEFAHFPDVEYYHIDNPVWYDRRTDAHYTQPFTPVEDMYLFLEDPEQNGGAP